MSSKRERVMGKKGRRPALRIGIIAVAAASAVILYVLFDQGAFSRGSGGGRPGRSGKYEVAEAENGIIAFDTAEFADGVARYYNYPFREATVSFFIMRSSDGVMRAAFDACDVCFREMKGYRQEGDIMVCNNCGQRFPSERINVERGGCNPAPLDRSVRDGQVEIAVSDIFRGLRYFNL